jgi:DNA invertase Pin-like site-specific DNA recombinase
VNVAGYCRVSTREQGDSGLSLASQKGTLAGAAATRGWTLERLVVDVATGANLDKRPQLASLLEALDRGEYDGLIVARLDRLSRSLADFAEIMDRAQRNGWTLALLDPALDTSEPWGRAMAGVAASFAELERALISQRTKEALAISRANGTKMGPDYQRYADEAVIARIVRLKKQGKGLKATASQLMAEGVPAPGGGQTWSTATISRILAREGAK